MIPELTKKLKALVSSPETSVALVLFLVAGLSFTLGHFSAQVNTEKQLIQAQAYPAIDNIDSNVVTDYSEPAADQISTPDTFEPNPGGYVASKDGTKYHLPWCGSAKRIKEENKIWFNTKEEAEAAGYVPAANCKGI